MLKKNCSFGLLALMSCIVIVTNAMAAAPEKVDAEKIAFLKDKQCVQALAKTKDLDGLEKAAAKIQAKWNKPEKDKKLYGRLMLEIVNRFASEPFVNWQRKKVLAQKYAILALQAADELPIEIELKLVVHLQADLHSHNAVKGKAWARQRTEQMKHWFRAYKRLHDTIDPKWDPKKADFTSGNVMLPPGVSGVAGMSPKHIKDPKLRAQYEAAIETNRRKVERYNQQYEARQLKKFFIPHAHRYIIQAYIHPPAAKAELEVFLKKYVKEAAVRAKILNAVEKKKMPDDLIPRIITTQPAKPKPTTQPAEGKSTTQPSEAK